MELFVEGKRLLVADQPLTLPAQSLLVADQPLIVEVQSLLGPEQSLRAGERVLIVTDRRPSRAARPFA